MKFRIYNDEEAKYVKTILKDNKISFSYKKKSKDNSKGEYDNEHKVESQQQLKKRGRKKMTKEEKEAKKKNRTKEQQEKINERMRKLREARGKKKVAVKEPKEPKEPKSSKNVEFKSILGNKQVQNDSDGFEELDEDED